MTDQSHETGTPHEKAGGFILGSVNQMVQTGRASFLVTAMQDAATWTVAGSNGWFLPVARVPESDPA